MKIVQLTQSSFKEVIAQATQVLQAGGLVIYPTETVYGAGVDATNQEAVDKLLQYKSRREGKPLSIAVRGQVMAEQFVEVNEQARQLYQQFLPGPMTIISQFKPGSQQLARGVASEFNTLGIRISSHPLVSQLVTQLNKPITATSANTSGKRRPYSISQILNHLSEKQKSSIDLIIDAGTLAKNPPSTVIDTTLSTPVIFRQGSLLRSSNTTKLISRSEIETKAIAGKLLLKHWDQVSDKPIVFGLNGPLGAGKTIFAKGIADFLGIQSTLVSPTYTYIEEYSFSRGQTLGTLQHIDVWKVDSTEMFNRLEIEQLLLPNTILVIEWFSQIREWLISNLNTTQADVIEVTLNDQNIQRELTIAESIV